MVDGRKHCSLPSVGSGINEGFSAGTVSFLCQDYHSKCSKTVQFTSSWYCYNYVIVIINHYLLTTSGITIVVHDAGIDAQADRKKLHFGICFDGATYGILKSCW